MPEKKERKLVQGGYQPKGELGTGGYQPKGGEKGHQPTVSQEAEGQNPPTGGSNVMPPRRGSGEKEE